MSRLVCVFPVDDSTNFLKSVRMVLEEKLGATIIRGDTTREEHRNEISNGLHKLTEQDVFVFMGHGASHCLYGSPKGGEPQPLFGKGTLSLPNRSRCLLVSCKSDDFKNSQLMANAIGFGELPATWEEVCNLRDLDRSRYWGVDEETVLEYQNCFVKALCRALELWDSSSPLYQLYQNIRLCITGQIVRHRLYKTLAQKRRQGLVEMLYDLKQEIDFH